ncbi:hypothetical protein BG28_08980 [Nesterenkonia sp. AN1]|nr:hypothetical protein BG28_08980 [Nesterenkonia sp. AN1]
MRWIHWPLEGVLPMRAEAEMTFNAEEAYAAHGRVLFSFALNALGDRVEAEDCVQETFIRAWRSESGTAARVAQFGPGCSR